MYKTEEFYNPYQMDNPLVSDAKTRKITGGEKSDRTKAKFLAKGIDLDKLKGFGNSAISFINKDSMDLASSFVKKDSIAGSVLDYASMGSKFGVGGAIAGGIIGGIKGAIDQKKMLQERIRKRIKEGNINVAQQGLSFKSQIDQRQAENVEDFYGLKSNDLYGAQDIDNFIEQNRV